MEGEMDNKRFYCLQCKFLFSRKALLDKHMETHASFRCFKCEYTTFVEEDLKKHSQSHLSNEIVKIRCPKCKFYVSRTALDSHVCQPFVCKTCGNKYTRDSSLKRHNRRCYGEVVETNNKVQPFVCTLCDFECSSESALQDHRDVHNLPTKIQAFACTVCDFKCSSESALQAHREVHNLPTIYFCHLCSAECNGESALKSHMENHTEEKEIIDLTEEKDSVDEPDIIDSNNNEPESMYTCTDCGYYFQSHLHLKWHLLTHIEKEYYACSECEYKTVKSYNLKMHKKQHVNQKMRSCSQCDYKTDDDGLLVKHQNIHTENTKPKHNLRHSKDIKRKSELSFICPYCSADCESLRELTKHMQTHTKSEIKIASRQRLRSRHNAKKLKDKNKMSAELVSPITVKISKNTENSNTKLNSVENRCTLPDSSQRKSEEHTKEPIIKEKIIKENIDGLERDYKTEDKILLENHTMKHLENSKRKLALKKYRYIDNVSELSNNKKKGNHSHDSKKSVDSRPCQIVSENKPASNTILCDDNKCTTQSLSEIIIENNDINIKQRNNHKILGCMECDVKCKSMKEFQLHKATHTTKYIGNKNLKKYGNLKSESGKVDQKQHILLSCNFCDYKTDKSYNLLTHKEKQHGQTVFKCDKCSYTTLFAKILKRHKKIHKVKKTDKNKTVISIIKLEKNYTSRDVAHVKITNNENKEGIKPHKDKQFKCLVCEYECDQLGALNTHMKERHSLYHTKETDMEAEEVKYKLKPNKKEDMEAEEVKYKMNPNNKVLDYLAKEIHNLKRIECTKCNFTFVTLSGLSKHMTVHHGGERRFSCPQCPFKTFFSYNLVKHEETHKKERFYCDECDFKCARKIQLKHHKQCEHSLLANHCPQCDYKCATSKELYMHIREQTC